MVAMSAVVPLRQAATLRAELERIETDLRAALLDVQDEQAAQTVVDAVLSATGSVMRLRAGLRFAPSRHHATFAARIREAYVVYEKIVHEKMAEWAFQDFKRHG
jgi:hypothetical protein